MITKALHVSTLRILEIPSHKSVTLSGAIKFRPPHFAFVLDSYTLFHDRQLPAPDEISGHRTVSVENALVHSYSGTGTAKQ
jgi:hypothetical protein